MALLENILFPLSFGIESNLSANVGVLASILLIYSYNASKTISKYEFSLFNISYYSKYKMIVAMTSIKLEMLGLQDFIVIPNTSKMGK